MFTDNYNKKGPGETPGPVPFFEVRKLPGLLIFEKKIGPYQRDVIIKRLPFVHRDWIDERRSLQHNRKVLVQALKSGFGLTKVGLNANKNSKQTVGT